MKKLPDPAVKYRGFITDSASEKKNLADSVVWFRVTKTDSASEMKKLQDRIFYSAIKFWFI